MSAETEIVMGWTGDSFIPASKHFAAVCDAHFVIGERYIVTAQAQRSMKSHRHYFATIGECFKNWPETAERQFDSADHLRAWALIRTGHRTERQFVASSRTEALRLAAFLRGADDYAEISVAGNTVVEWRAASQSAHAMGAQTFAKSKDDVLAYLAEIIGTPIATLRVQHESAGVASRGAGDTSVPPAEPPRAIVPPQPSGTRP